MNALASTIFALSSGLPPSGIAVVRVSGPGASLALQVLSGSLPNPRKATRAKLCTAAGDPIDDGLLLWFPGPHSATGEDVAEFHIHGGRAVIAALLAALSTIADLRPAGSGEFTQRAFENGKLDLTEAEGLDDLIHADTEQQRRQALRQLNGLLGNRARDWRQRVIECCAIVEAGIDFSDEGDIPAETLAEARGQAQSLRDEIEDVLATQGQSERLREGLVVAITGPPNVGKSTLLNRLARRDVAIVSDHPGTTRDIIEVNLDLGGYPVTLIDTAGLRKTTDPVEQEGVRRALARAADADLRLWLVDAQVPARDGDESLQAWIAQGQQSFWVVRNKVDQPVAPGRTMYRGFPCYAISALTGSGIPELLAALVEFVSAYFGVDAALITRARQRTHLRAAADSLARAVEAPAQAEIVAEELRVAANELGRLLGRVDIEDVLGAIFSRFCVGK